MKLFNQELVEGLQQAANLSPRKRANHNVHQALDESVQRLFISISPGTYVRPHRHLAKEKYEFFLMVSGELTMLIFDEDGTLVERQLLRAGGEVFGLEIPPGTFHTVLPGEQTSTFLEVKQGPYAPLNQDEVAPWSPAEGDSEVEGFMAKLSRLQVGETVRE